ncbi:hypothetical protein ABB07_00600 [Streptomyces incarnatus]|uniref:Integral membrane protein n=1 Tax=Streptomyces incarnatus TaxID=665007 RepID=A0ABN4G8S2_9ACTN|nr:hypothetical protein [Streptomyces incarnatus]AKJ08599.1 hypothetical protein ABB07_00600 [Streptomyces incarnatus]
MPGSGRLHESYTLQLGCLLRAKVRGNVVNTRWLYHVFSGAGFVRPQTPDTVIKVECPRCKSVLAMTVESLRKAETKRRAHIAVGAGLLASLLVWVPMLVSAGGRTADEGHAQPGFFSVGVLFFLAAFSFVVGLALFLNGRAYYGIRRVRLVRPDGGLSVNLRGHKVGYPRGLVAVSRPDEQV